jgi:hypothetical protein
MQEICQSGSEGGAKPTLSLPLSPPPKNRDPNRGPSFSVLREMDEWGPTRSVKLFGRFPALMPDSKSVYSVS